MFWLRNEKIIFLLRTLNEWPDVSSKDLGIWEKCHFQQYGILTCEHSDELVQPPFKLRKTHMMLGQKLNTHSIFKRLAKALIKLRVCAG